MALRTAIQHPALVDRLILVSTVFKRRGWHPEMVAGMDAMGPQAAEAMKQSPMYETYQRIAPRVEDWPILVEQVSDVVKVEYDWSDEVRQLSMPVMLVAGDADGLPPSHAVEFFGLLGGGLRDAGWDRSGMTPHRLAILPGVTHYDINVVPASFGRGHPVPGRGVAGPRPLPQHAVGQVRDAGCLDHPHPLELASRRRRRAAARPRRAGSAPRAARTVDEAGGQVLLDRARAAPIWMSWSPAARLACSSADSIPSVTKWKVVPPSISSGSRAWWVSTKTG